MIRSSSIKIKLSMLICLSVRDLTELINDICAPLSVAFQTICIPHLILLPLIVINNIN